MAIYSRKVQDQPFLPSDLLKKYAIFCHWLSPVLLSVINDTRQTWLSYKRNMGMLKIIFKKRLKIPKRENSHILHFSFVWEPHFHIPAWDMLMLHYSKGSDHDLFPSCGISSLFHLAGLSHFSEVRISSLAILMAMHCTRKPS